MSSWMVQFMIFGDSELPILFKNKFGLFFSILPVSLLYSSG